MLKYIIAILLSLPVICNADTWNWNETKKINPYTGNYDFSTTSPAYSATSAYSNNSDKLDGFNYTFFLSTNTALTQYWIGKATSSLDMSNYPIYDASTISIATNSASGYLQISDKYILIAATTSKTIQAIINLYGDNMTYEFLASTISVNSQINIFRSNITFKGQGYGTVFLAQPWANWTTIGHVIYSTGTAGLTIGNIKLDGLAANTGQTKDLIYIRKANYLTIQNVWADYSDNNGIYIEGCDYVFVDHNIATNCDVEGIYFYGYDNTDGVYRGYQTIVSYNIIRACADGINLIYCRASEITNNYIWGTTAWAITCSQTNYGLSIKDNTIFSASGGIFFYGTLSNGFTASLNDIQCSGTAIFCQGDISAGSITNNNIIITGSAGDGINVGSYNNCSNLNIIGNTIVNRGTNRGSIYAQDMSNSLIAFNNCTNTTAKAGYGFRLDKGTGNVIVSNLSNNHTTADILLAAFTYQNQLLGNINKDGVKITDSGRETCLQTLQDCKWGFGVSSPTHTVDIAGSLNVTGAAKFRLPYATFYSTTTQTIAVANTTYTVTLDGAIDAHGINVSTTGVMTFPTAGEYEFIISAIFDGLITKHIGIFPQMNNVNVANSNSIMEFASNNGETLIACSYIFDVNANDTVNFIWYSDSTSSEIKATVAGTTPITPASPSILITIKKIGEIQ